MGDTVEIPALSEQQMRLLSGAESGRIAFDERGSAVYQFAPSELSDIEHDRLPAGLDHPGLSLVNEEPVDTLSTTLNTLGMRSYYKPAGGEGRDGKKKPRADLRELSRWIELKRKLAARED